MAEIALIIKAVLELIALVRLPSRDFAMEEKALYKIVRAAHDELARRRFGSNA